MPIEFPNEAIILGALALLIIIVMLSVSGKNK